MLAIVPSVVSASCDAYATEALDAAQALRHAVYLGRIEFTRDRIMPHLEEGILSKLTRWQKCKTDVSEVLRPLHRGHHT